MKLVPLRAAIVVLVCLLVLPSAFSQRHELPKALGQLLLVNALEGKDAQAFVNQLHQKAVAPKSSVAGEYKGGNNSATLYVSLYSSERQAKVAGLRMMQLIKGGNRAFGQYSEQNHGRLLIGRCVGMGQIHHLFQEGDRLFWLSVDPSREKAALESLLASISHSRRK